VDGLAVASNMRPHIDVEAMVVGAVVHIIHSLSRPVRRCFSYVPILFLFAHLFLFPFRSSGSCTLRCSLQRTWAAIKDTGLDGARITLRPSWPPSLVFSSLSRTSWTILSTRLSSQANATPLWYVGGLAYLCKQLTVLGLTLPFVLVARDGTRVAAFVSTHSPPRAH
jgi:hypothetical protein